jgi:Protein of unknown function (DUF3253)
MSTEGKAETPVEAPKTEDDPLAAAILALLAEQPSGRSVTPDAVARAFAAARAKPNDPPDLWRRYLQGVREQALHLARDRRLVILRKGRPADPSHRIKGLIRLALPGGEPS